MDHEPAREATLMAEGDVDRAVELVLRFARAGHEAGCTAVFGREASVFVAALTVGIVGGVVGSRLRRSPLVFIVPGVLMLVPGSAGFNSALQLLSNQTVSGISAAFDTFVTAMSIAYGLIVSASLFPGHAAPPSRADDLGAP